MVEELRLGTLVTLEVGDAVSLGVREVRVEGEGFADTDSMKLKRVVGVLDIDRLGDPLGDTELDKEGEPLWETLGESWIELEGVAEKNADIDTDRPEEKEREIWELGDPDVYAVVEIVRGGVTVMDTNPEAVSDC